MTPESPATPRYVFTRRLALMALDVALMVFVFWLTYLLRLSNIWPLQLQQQIWLLLLLVPVGIAVLSLSGWYRGLTRYATSHSMYGLLPRTALFLLIVAILRPLFGLPAPPRSFWPFFWFLYCSSSIGVRVVLRDFLRLTLSGPRRPTADGAGPVDQQRRPALVYGAGESGSRLIDALRFDPSWQLVGVIDDDPSLWMWSRQIQGLPIVSPDQLPPLIRRRGVKAVLLAVPSASRSRRRELVNQLQELGLEVLTIPSLQELASGHVRVADLRRVAIEDLLGRDPSSADPALLSSAVGGKSVLITGGGGSIGSELARQVFSLAPTRLVLLDHTEYSLYTIERELRQLIKNDPSIANTPFPELHALLGDVTDQSLVERICRQHAIEVLFHAAAYKHVPLVENNLSTGLRNNILGTKSALEASLASGVERFILISTDKAVRPTNAMGASKRVCELLVLEAAARQKHTICSMVRFGNVLGSSGSVVPLFREQIASGGPVTVTHPDVIRYFMTIGEAVQLVLQSLALAQGGEVFLLDMGEPVAITDLARQMIELSGCTVRDETNPDGDIAIEFTGLRPGEKLYEELLVTPDDRPTSHPLIRQATENAPESFSLHQHVDALLHAAASDETDEALRLLTRLVPDYRPSNRTSATVRAALGSSSLSF